MKTLFEEALDQLLEAHEELSWSGSTPPEDRPAIEEHYQRKRKAVLEYVEALEGGDKYDSSRKLRKANRPEPQQSESNRFMPPRG